MQPDLEAGMQPRQQADPLFADRERTARLLHGGGNPEFVLPGCDDRGVSDTVGFVFIFALIVSSVGVVSVVGYGSLQDARDHERVNNAERAFEVLSENVEDVRRDGAPSRATEIKLGGAAIRTGEPITVNVTAHGNGTATSTGVLSVTPIVYEAQTGEQIRYTNGAIVRSDGDAAWFVREPKVLLDTERTMVPVIALDADTQRSIAGDRTVHVRTIRLSSDVIAADTGDTYDNLTIRMQTSNADLWDDYYTEQGMSCSQPSDGVVTCTRSDLDRVYITLVQVEVGFG